MKQISLKAMRADSNLSLAEVSEKTGFASNTIKRWETGESEPPVKKTKVLLELYGFKFEDLKI